MTRIYCKDVLLDYIQKNGGWHKKALLYPIAEEFLAETVGRALRDLVEEGKINVDYYKGVKRKVNLAMYSRLGEAPKKFEPNIVEINGRRVLLLNE